MNRAKSLLLKYITKRDKLEYQLEEVNELIESIRTKFQVELQKEEELRTK